ncbi:hypothetical protein N9Y42_02490 [Mariniblastus sp.]|nr:hypothetical protein [Mariniblastus sp.]
MLEESPIDSWLYPSYLGFVYAQTSLIGIWCCFSARVWWFRWIISTALWFAVISDFLIPDRSPASSSLDDEALFGTCVLIVVSVGCILRPMLGSLKNFHEKAISTGHQRVSIGHLFVWTTQAGVLIAFLVSRWPKYSAMLGGFPTSYIQMGILAGCLAIVCGWVLFSRRPLTITLAAVVFTPIISTLSVYLVHEDPWIDFTPDLNGHFVRIYASQALMMLSNVWLARWAGVRRQFPSADR